MSEGKRPGGLTALAVLNFVGGALDAIAAFGMVFVILVAEGVVPLEGPQRDELMAAWNRGGESFVYLEGVACSVLAVFLIASGVGYLKQKRFLGRTLGNVYAVSSIAATVAETVLVAGRPEGDFSLGTIIAVIYPVLTLALLNTAFKEDFYR